MSIMQKEKFHIKENLPFFVIILISVVLLVSYFVFFSNAEEGDDEDTKTAIEKYEDELPSLKRSAKNNPDDAQSQRDYAVALYATGNLEDAKEYYEKELTLNEKDAVLRNNLGNVYRDLEEYDSAVDSYKKAIELDPKLVNPYYNLCNLLVYTLDRAEEALEIYTAGIESIPEKEEDFLNSIGLVYEYLKDTSNAISTYEKVLEINPENTNALAGLDRLQ
jgi:tetratricopeptide (TPR) repeat protein